jgi:8-oxo-dGTP pyrophosphatase MutT (NUDIX family)
MLTLEHVRQGLSPIATRHPATGSGRSRAAVAIVLAGEPDAPELCFMQRVHRSGDRWSGDVALPGGWAREDETLLRDAAVRETREEVGIQLRPEQHIGDVPAMRISRGSDAGGIIGASVFYAGTRHPPLVADPVEVADAFWVPGAHLYAPDNRTTVAWSRSGPPRPRPAVAFQDRIIWGLTYRILVRFSALALGDASPLDSDSN